jgi:LPS sulfotransferase NodH
MVIFDQIVKKAKGENKNILVIGAPRSGTHAVGAELANLTNAKYLREICRTSDNPTPWHEIKNLYSTETLTVAQIVQLTPKIHLAKDVQQIKDHAVIVNVRRKNKIKQFASWMYFRVNDTTELHGWHNHKVGNTRIAPHSLQVQEQDLTQFMLEQLIDDYFLPDFNLCYEDLTFTQKMYEKNQFSYPIENIFTNLDFVENFLKDWSYSSQHFSNE